MESENTCKLFSECEIDTEYKESECKQKSFEELVSESKSGDVVVKLGKLGIIRWLLANANRKKLQASDIEYIITEKCSYNSTDEEIVNVLKENDVFVEINIISLVSKGHKWRSSALHCAIKRGTPEIFSWILESKVNSHIITPEYLNFIVPYVLNNLENLIKLVSLGADIAHKEIKILYHACNEGNLSVLKWLLAHKELNEKTPDILSKALKCAVKCRRFHFIEYLMQNGAKLIPVCEDEDRTIIQQAALCGNINFLKCLIQNNANFFSQKSMDSLVHIAAEFGHLDLLKWLVSQDCNIHVMDDDKNNALHKATLTDYKQVTLKEGNIGCIKYLVHKKVNINAMNKNGYSPMYHAVSSKNLDIVKFLIAHGGNIHAKYGDDNTSLHAAANSFEMIQMLVSLGLDINARNSKNRSVLSFATENYNYKAVEWLLEQGILPIDDFLLVATSRNWFLGKDPNILVETLKVGIKYISDINSLINGEILLHKAINFNYGNIEVIKLLLENNADVNILRPSDNSSPLICSLYRYTQIIIHQYDDFHSYKVPPREPDIAQYLLSKGADVTIRNNKGETALYHSLRLENIDVIKQLIELGADVNAVTSDDTSILQQAVQKNNLEIVKLIVESGADVHQVTTNNMSSLNYAAKCFHWHIVKYLIENGADINNDIDDESRSYHVLTCATRRTILNSRRPDVQLINWLIRHGADFSLIEELVSLHLFCNIYKHLYKSANEAFEYIELLINNDIDINEVDDYNDTILHTCIDDVKIVDYLLKRGIAINKVNNSGKTELHVCIEKKYDDISCQNKSRIVKKLINHGAIVNTADENGITPLHLAVSDPLNIGIARILIDNGANVNATDLEDNSVLHFTVDEEIAILLCEKGADINAKNKHGVTVLHRAIKNVLEEEERCDIVKPLKRRKLGENSATGETPINISSIMRSRYYNYIKYIINNVDNINVKDNEGFSALHYANSNPKILELLHAKSAMSASE